MNETMISCPNCNKKFELTESLAAPLLKSMQQQFEQKIAQKEGEVSKREEAIRKQQIAIEKSKKELDQQVAEKLKSERENIKIEEAKKARAALADQISKSQQDKAAVEERLKERNNELAKSQKNELELRKERQKLQEEKEQFELKLQRAIDEERTKIRESVQKNADELIHLKIAEKEKTISDLQKKLQEALRKAEQGSQQLQGEVQELELESLLQTKFPQDIIDPVPKGEYGGDVLHHILNQAGQNCGTILWESKRTKNWNDNWLAKLREDQRAAGANIAIIVSQILPKDIKTFDLIDGVWVVEPRNLIPIALVLRQSLTELFAVQHAMDGKQTKMEMVYQYLMSPRFRHRIEAIIEKFSDMQEDLNKERKLMNRSWAKRETQIRGVLESTAGMYGDLQGIAGKTFQEIEGLDIQILDKQEEDIPF